MQFFGGANNSKGLNDTYQTTNNLCPGLENHAIQKGHGHMPMKVPNVKFNFNVCVDNIQFLTHASKS